MPGGGRGRGRGGRHVEVSARDRFTGKEDGQDYGRVVAMLGSRRVRCFCNDGVERVCKIRGKLCQRGRKKFIVVGDIVLISPRDFSGPLADDSEGEGPADMGVWDLIDRIEPPDWRTIKKEGGHHPNLFGDGTTGAPKVDIFAMEDDVDIHKEAVAAAAEEEEELNIDNI
jgi:initiation factor 1A